MSLAITFKESARKSFGTMNGMSTSSSRETRNYAKKRSDAHQFSRLRQHPSLRISLRAAVYSVGE
eukprot:395338-Pleurochrysis_carterae.AAC.1